MANQFADLIKTAAKGTDYTVEQKGGNFERELPAEGIGVCRFREYIEIGTQETATAMYPNKKPAAKARFVFELTTPKHVRTIEKEDGSSFNMPFTLNMTCPISASEKSNYIKMFRALNWDNTITHPAQALGKPFMIEVVHAWAKGDDLKTTKPSYANMRKDGVILLSPPRKVDALTGDFEELKVPELLGDMLLFLWDNPTKETWDSLFIDGEREKDGVTVSKNWLQELILHSQQFEGSALHTMLAGVAPVTEDVLAGIGEDEVPY